MHQVCYIHSDNILSVKTCLTISKLLKTDVNLPWFVNKWYVWVPESMILNENKDILRIDTSGGSVNCSAPFEKG